jgi:hypothetical protein
MKRKSFIKKAAAATAGSVILPYILPSGTLFAATPDPKSEYVVYVLFAGGVRQQESVLQGYLNTSQDLDSSYAGNIMPNLLQGAMPTKKIAFGTTSSGGTVGDTPIPKILSNPLVDQGVLFKEVKAVNPGHYGGLNSLLTGNSSVAQGLKVRPNFPTIFEYARKHLGLKATETWFIGNTIANSYNLLNGSEHPDYGLQYGANFFAPTVTFGQQGRNVLSNGKIYHPQEEMAPMYKMKNFLDNAFRVKQGQIPSIKNTDEDKNRIKEFVRNTFQKQAAGQIPLPPVADGGDLFTLAYAAEVMKEFKPKILVVNMTAVDVCHGNFSAYLRALHRADHGVGWLWNYIQTQIPEMSGKTTILISPECGRNLNPNPITDENDWLSFDHSDSNTSRVFTLMAGAALGSNRGTFAETYNPSNPGAYTTDNVLTIADIMGIKNMIPPGFMYGPSRSLFDRF